MLTCYRGHILSPVSNDNWIEFPSGAIVVKDGKIIQVSEWATVKKTLGSQDKIIDYGSKIILPGLIDLHVHLVQMAAAGKWGVTLLDWLNRFIFPAETKFRDKNHAKRLANWFFRELAKNGTTLACVLTTVHHESTNLAFEAAASLGNKVIMGLNLMDTNSPAELTVPTNESLKQTEDLCKRWHGFDNDRILYAFTPRYALTSTPELLKSVANLRQKYPNTYIHTHLAENVDEVAMVKKGFPKNRSYLDVYKSFGLLGPNSLFAHGIYLDDEDLSDLNKSGSAVVHCPSSNFFLKSGVFPLAKMKEAKISIGLGSDVAAGPELSMFKCMKDSIYIQPNVWIAPKECFYLATLGAARAINLDKTIGSLEVGKDADFIVVDPTIKSGVADNMLDQSADDILSALVYLGDDRVVLATYIRGKAIYEQEQTSQYVDSLSKAKGH